MQSRRLISFRRPPSGFALFASLASLAFTTLHCGGEYDDDDDSAYVGPGRYDSGSRGGAGGSSSGPPPGGNTAGNGGLDDRPGDRGDGAANPDEPQAAPACSSLDSTKPLELYLSADDSNSMASPVIARRFIREQGTAPPPYVLRTYEFLNYYNVPYAQPAPGSLGVDAQLRLTAAGEFELQVGVHLELQVDLPRRLRVRPCGRV